MPWEFYLPYQNGFGAVNEEEKFQFLAFLLKELVLLQLRKEGFGVKGATRVTFLEKGYDFLSVAQRY